MARARRADRPTRRAPCASQDSLVSFQPRGPQTSRNISCALTIAGMTADSFADAAGLCGNSTIGCLMLLNMRKPTNRTNWISIGTLARGLAARLVAAREEFQREERAADAPSTRRAAEATDPLACRKGRPTTGEECRRAGAARRVGARRWDRSTFESDGKVRELSPLFADLDAARCGTAASEIV